MQLSTVKTNVYCEVKTRGKTNHDHHRETHIITQISLIFVEH